MEPAILLLRSRRLRSDPGEALGQQLRDVKHPKFESRRSRRLRFGAKALQLKKTRDVRRRDDFRSSELVVCQSVQTHAARDSLFLYGEDTSKTAAFVGSRQVNELESLDGREQRPRGIGATQVAKFTRCSQAQFAEGVTTRV